MKRRPRAPFVVTMSTLSLVACGREAPQPAAATVDVPPVNPPSTATATATTATTATAGDDRPDFAQYPRSLNPTDASGQLVLRGWGTPTSCYVELPWPKGQPRLPGQVKTQSVPCPPAMLGEAWAACAGGTINARKEPGASDCACFQGGNPPPIPHRVTCP
jgi:hypothetical protein